MTDAFAAGDVDFRALLEAAPDRYLVLSPALVIVAVTDSYLAATMTSRDAIVGRPLFAVFPDDPSDPTADGVARLRASLEHVLALRRPDEMAVQRYAVRRPADGTFEERFWRPTNVPVLDASGQVRLIIHRVEDVTERVRREREQVEKERLTADRLKSAVDAMDDGFALFDSDDRLILCNGVYRALVRQPDPARLVGKSYGELLHACLGGVDLPDDAAHARFMAERSARPRRQTLSHDVRMRDGRSLRCVDRATPEGGTLTTVLDRTADESREIELSVAREAAEAGSAAKSEFLASMSHELRTPLNAILGFAQLLERDRREPLSERHRSRVSQILRGGEHLLRLIDEVLDLSRIETGAVTISVEPVELDEVLDEVVQTLEPMAARNGLTIAIDPPPAPSLVVRVDRTRFAQIIMNFGSNALKYNRPNGRVRLATELVGEGHVRVIVHDTGFGIPTDKQDQLFQPFQRAGQETGPIEGTGIGLVITRRLAALMAGRVGFSSVEGEGSAFWVDVPRQAPAPISRRIAAAVVASSPRPEGGRTRRVLYVEDNPGNVAFMADLLGSVGDVELLVAPNAERGVALAQGARPDLVIMDVNLPGMSGVEALRKLRADERTRAVPVVALSAAASERDRRRGEQAGFHRYLTKPVKVDELLSTMESIFDAIP